MRHSWFDFFEKQLLFSRIFGLLFFLVVMAAEFLHYVSDGAIPQLIEWQPAQKRRIDAENMIKYVGEEEDADFHLEADES